LLEIDGSGFSTTQHNLQFRNITTGQESIHFHSEVNWTSSTEINVDMASISALLWPSDSRLALEVRLTSYDGSSYLPVSDWSPRFLLAATAEACDHLPPQAFPSDFKVLMINFNPIIESAGGVRLTELKGWHDPASLTAQYISDATVASHGYISYQVVTSFEVDDIPRKMDGFDYSDESYLLCIDNPATCHMPDTVDYGQIFEDFDICTRVEQDGIDEVWLWGGPYFGYWEYNLRGPFLNITPENIPLCGPKTLYVMGFNYERGNAEMLEDLGHRAEGVLVAHIADGNWQQNEANEWNKFSLVAAPVSTYLYGHCGNVHYPPNGLSDYDWGNLRYVQSDCDDWYNYPDLGNNFVSLNCTTWGCNGYSYISWWLQHLPHAGGTMDGHRNDWWRYVVDYDYALCPMHDPECDRMVTVVDIQLVAAAWNCASEDACYQLHLDLNGDRLVDILDIITVADRWGCVDGSDCYGDPMQIRVRTFATAPHPPVVSQQ
jgi:hypothetical protein